jgi:hypothetical protein
MALMGQPQFLDDPYLVSTDTLGNRTETNKENNFS